MEHNSGDMAETLPLSIFSLFNVVVEDIHLLDAVRYSNANFQTNLARLAGTQLQLSRWGTAVGLDVEKEEASQFNNLVPEEDRLVAKQTLHSMLKELEIAKKKIKPYYKKEGEDGRKGSISDGDSPADGRMESMTEATRKWSFSRSKKSKTHDELPLSKKARWAIVDQFTFEKLLDSITELMAKLENLFPSKQAEMMRLASDELEELKDEMKRIVKCLEDHNVGLGKLLTDVLKEAAKEQKSGGDTITNSFSGPNHGVQGGRDVSWTGGLHQGK